MPFLRRAIATCFWLACAFTLFMALNPSPDLQLVKTWNDKIQHMAAFAVLTLLATIAFPRAKAITVFAVMAGFGAAIEVLQMIPALHRDAELNDWIADCVAVLAVLTITRPLIARRRRVPARR